MVLAAVAAPAAAAVTTDRLDVSFAKSPYTVSLGGGNTLTFTTVDPGFFALAPAGVSTGGTTQVGSFGAPFYDPPQPTSYFSNRGGSFGPGGENPLFLSYSAPAAVPYSISEGLVGFRFDLGKGYQYGYADITGSYLSGVRFQTTPGEAVAFGVVPEPASWVLLIAGFGMIGATLRRRRIVATV